MVSRRLFLSLFCTASLFMPLPFLRRAIAEPIGLIERYALAADRQSVLDSLIPGSEDYYFLHCLHFQVTGQLERAESFLSDWERERQPQGETEALRAIRDRQRLLTYGSNPRRTMEYLTQRLGVSFDHAPPHRVGERRWPQELDPQLLATDRLIEESVRNNQPLPPAGLSRLADRLLRGEVPGLAVDLSWVTQQMQGRWYPALAELVIAELRSRRPGDLQFGDRPCHRLLTLTELEKVRAAFPQLGTSDALIHELLMRLRPSEDADLGQQPEVRFAYLQRVEQFTRTLSAPHNSLKAAAIYRLLQAHLQRGEYPRELFLQYLRLPRQSPLIFIVRDRPAKRPAAAEVADLNADYTQVALLPPIRDEEPLVRAYLEHFLVSAPSTDEFQGLLETQYLNRVFAETKLLYGIEDPQRWYRNLSSSERSALTERVELTLAPINPQHSDPQQPAAIIVDVKRVGELLVRVYKINSRSYYREHETLIDTDLDLDGLVATDEYRFTYSQGDIRRHRETIPLPTVQGRGIWVIDLLGGGLRSRAILRRGDLRYLEQRGPSGNEFLVLDERRQLAPGARMLVAGQEFLADQEGRITLPPVDQTLTRRGVLMDNDLAVPVVFTLYGEDYQLQASMVVQRQQLRSGQMAEVLVRPRLMLGDGPVDPAMLGDGILTIVAIDQDGIETTKRFEDLKFSQEQETVVRFRTPSRLAKLRATLEGRLPSLATGRQLSLSTSQEWELNGIEQTTRTSDLHLTQRDGGWVIEVRGINGEPVVGGVVQLQLFSRYCTAAIETTLETDNEGLIRLGKLDEITRLVMTGGDGVPQNRTLQTASAVWPQRLHSTSEEPLVLPLDDPQAELGRTVFLYATTGDRITEDLTKSALKIDRGLLRIGPQLAGGDYALVVLRDWEMRTVPISITAGPVVDDVAAGSIRNLQLRWPQGVSIEQVEHDPTGLTIRLSGDTSAARVHLLGSRYLPQYDSLAASPPSPLRGGVALASNGYLSELRLGEEYLYVLRRQYAKKYPGVMLPQPSLLLAPWVTEETKNTESLERFGDVPMAAGTAAPPGMRGEGRDGYFADRMAGSQSQSLNFLGEGGAMLVNLRPDAEGILRIPREALGDSILLQVVVVDPLNTVTRLATLPWQPLKSRDLRLAEPLPVAEPYTLLRSVLIASAAAPLKLESLGTAQFQTYATVADVLRYYRTLAGDSRLDEFLPLGRWHTLDESEKQDLYGRLACHELHVFLKAKDPQFFAQVVRPYLENKLDKQLIDHWLLDRDLTPWTDLWSYNRLSAFEKGILARQLPAVREAILREFRDQIAATAPEVDLERRLIEFGLAGGGLDAERKSGLMLGRNEPQGAAEAEALGVQLAEAADAGGAMFTEGLPLPSGGIGGGGMGGMGTANAAPSRSAVAAEDASKEKNAAGRRMLRSRAKSGKPAAFFQQLDATKQWGENHWDLVRVSQPPASLISIDPFWLAWSEHDGSTPFISDSLLRPSVNRHAALIALALLDLPLESSGVELPTETDTPWSPPHPIAIVTKRLQKLEQRLDDVSLLVGQRFEGVNTPTDPAPREGSPVKIAPDEFLTGQPYRGQIVITNPTPQQQTVECFWQIPAGSIPLATSQASDSRTVVIEPFQVAKIEYQFYFPAAGSFVHYPVCLSAQERVVARGTERTFAVVDQPTKIDETSWEQIAASGTPERIARFLATANLRKLDWSPIAHRLRERAVYDVVLPILEQGHLWDATVWGYALFHQDRPRIKTFLEHQEELASAVGPVLDCEIMEVQPIKRAFYEHLEYAPLVQARIHPLRNEPEILNDRFLAQYRALMRVIAFQRQIRIDQQLALCYYLLLQNRIEEAIARLPAADSTAEGGAGMLENRLQRDYLAAYLAMHEGNYPLAGQIAENHLQHPVPRWRQRFSQILLQLTQQRELVSGAQLTNSGGNQTASEGVRTDAADLAILDREQRQAAGTEGATEVQLRVEGDRLVIDYRNVREATLRFYGVDLELLFSKTPMIEQNLQRMAIVQPSRSETLTLEGSTGVASFPLDDALARQTMLVEVVAGPARDTALYYGGKLRTYLSEGFGQLQVSDRNSGDPVPAAYVKVYSKSHDGSVKFYKDGYTDLRGRFDYATLSTGNLGEVQRFSILVLDAERGATVHEVAPPTK